MKRYTKNIHKINEAMKQIMYQNLRNSQGCSNGTTYLKTLNNPTVPQGRQITTKQTQPEMSTKKDY